MIADEQVHGGAKWCKLIICILPRRPFVKA